LLALAIADEPTNEEVPEESTENSEESDDTPLGPSEFAQTTVLFPDYPDKSKCFFHLTSISLFFNTLCAEFVQGEFVEVLCGFKNTGDKSFNITMLKGSLNSPYDHSMYIQNFTEQAPFNEIKTGEEGTLAYKFFPDPGLEPRDYVLTLYVDYVDADKEEYRTVYYNSTIEIVESQSSLDMRTFFGRVLSVVFFALVALVGYHLYKKFGTKKRSKSDVKTTSSNNEWLEGSFGPSEPRRAGSGKKPSAKKTS
jgi:hypothetical protein